MKFGHILHPHVIVCYLLGICSATGNLVQFPFAPFPSKGFLFSPGHPPGAREPMELKKKAADPIPGIHPAHKVDPPIPVAGPPKPRTHPAQKVDPPIPVADPLIRGTQVAQRVDPPRQAVIHPPNPVEPPVEPPNKESVQPEQILHFTSPAPTQPHANRITASSVLNSWVEKMQANPKNSSVQFQGCSVISVLAPNLDVSEDPHLLGRAWKTAAEAAINHQDDMKTAFRCVQSAETATESRHAELLLDHTKMFEALTKLMEKHADNLNIQHMLLPMMTKYSSFIAPEITVYLESLSTFNHVFSLLRSFLSAEKVNDVVQMDVMSFLSGIARDINGGKLIVAHNGTQMMMELLDNHPKPYYGSRENTLTLRYEVLNVISGLLQNNLDVDTLVKKGLVLQILSAMQSEPDRRGTQDIACASMAYLARLDPETVNPLVTGGAIELIMDSMKRFNEDDLTPFAPGLTLGGKFLVIPWCTMALENLGAQWDTRVHMVKNGLLEVLEKVRPELQNTVKSLRQVLLETKRLLF